MAKRESLRTLTAAVAHAEVIPAGRPLSREEIALLDRLAARLTTHLFGDRSEKITDLLRRVSAVRTGKRETTLGSVESKLSAPTAKKRPPARQKKKEKKTAHKLAIELHRISAAGRPIGNADAVALDGIVEASRLLAVTDRRARLLWLRALDIREYLTGTSSDPDRDRSGVPSAGRIGRSRGLDLAKREVLGGLPSSRRRH